MRPTGRARRGARATTACRWRQRVVPRDAGHRGQRVLSRLSGRESGTFASGLVQFAITRVAVPRRANGPGYSHAVGVDRVNLTTLAGIEYPHPSGQLGGHVDYRLALGDQAL